MRAIIHIGTERTGGHLIQQALKNEASALAASGVHLCKTGLAADNRPLASAFASDEFCDEFMRQGGIDDIELRGIWRKAYLGALDHEIATAAEYAHTFLISSDQLHTKLTQPLEISAFADYLRSKFEDVKIVIYLRQQHEMAIGSYAEALRAGGIPQNTLPIGQIKQNPVLPYLFDLKSVVERWGTVFGSTSLELAIYETEFFGSTRVAADFFNRISVNTGLQVTQVAKPLGVNGLAALKAFNLKADELQIQREEIRYLRHEFVKFLKQRDDSPRLLPSRELAEQFYALFEEDNTTLARTWLNRERLFDTNFDKYPETLQTPDVTWINEVISEFWQTYTIANQAKPDAATLKLRAAFDTTTGAEPVESALSSTTAAHTVKHYPDSYEEGDFVFFLHIPKTAGTSFTNSLTQVFPEERTITHHQANNILAYPLSHYLDAELLTGHFLYDVHSKRLPRKPEAIVTFLREPVAHMISTYFHLRVDPDFTYSIRIGGPDKTLSHDIHRFVNENPIEAFLDHPYARIFSNFQCNYLVKGLTEEQPSKQSDALASRALDLLIQLPAFGLTERYAESLVLFNQFFGKEHELHVFEDNAARGKPRDFDLSDETRAKIAELCSADIKLYQGALDTFETRLAEAQPNGPQASADAH